MIAAISSKTRRATLAGALALLGTCFAGAASAQEKTTGALKGGVFFPTTSNLRSQTTDTWYALGLDVQPGFKYHPLGGNVHLGIDGVWHGSGASRGRTMSFTGKLIWPINPKGRYTHFWGGVGAGGYLISTPNITDFITVGAKFIAGVDLSNRIFIEADYDWVSGFTDDVGNSIRNDGATITLGFRF